MPASIVKPAKPLPVQEIKLDAATMQHEADVYGADPTGGQPSRY